MAAKVQDKASGRRLVTMTKRFRAEFSKWLAIHPSVALVYPSFVDRSIAAVLAGTEHETMKLDGKTEAKAFLRDFEEAMEQHLRDRENPKKYRLAWRHFLRFVQDKDAGGRLKDDNPKPSAGAASQEAAAANDNDKDGQVSSEWESDSSTDDED